MPWPAKQRTAIFLNVQRKKGTAAAEQVMREAGYGKGKKKKRKGHSKVAGGLMQRGH